MLSDASNEGFVKHYLTGLSMLAKNDVHFRIETNALQEFYRALREAMRFYGDWDGVVAFSTRVHCYFRIHESEYDGILSLAERSCTAQQAVSEVSLSEVAGMKVICDGYLMQTFHRLAVERHDGSDEGR
jgi:hypothetical protein